MCGILVVHASGALPDAQALANRAELTLAHRGPDGVGAAISGRSAVAHTRLAIVDVKGGRQPMCGEDGRTLLVCNGEVYNHRLLREHLRSRHEFTSKSDSEVILHLFEDMGAECVVALDGMFAFFVSDGERFAAARDPLGIKPLYVGRGKAEELWFASEIKALIGQCKSFGALAPGSVMTQTGAVRRWFSPSWGARVGKNRDVSGKDLVDRLERSVMKRLMSDVPMGVLLSGGLDSSIVAALAQAHLGQVKTFAVGVEGSEDLAAAKFMARALGTDHHQCTYSYADVARELERIIYHLESYDPALIRSAVPCYFVSRLAADHVKVVLTGEGADELFGGYSHLSAIRDPSAFHWECTRLLLGLHAMNLQRVDRMTMAHGLEGRVPFLDVEFVDWAMSIDPELKLHRFGKIEKRLLREAASRFLPEVIVRRPKREFSAGSGGDQLLTSYADAKVSARDLSTAGQRFPIDPPKTKEEFLYRMLFEQAFPGEAARRTVERWHEHPPAPAQAASEETYDGGI